MIVWGMIVGALVGWCLALIGSVGGSIGAVVGGLAGLVAGKTLQASVRAEIERATRELRFELRALRRERDDVPRAEAPLADIRETPPAPRPVAQPEPRRVVPDAPRPAEPSPVYVAPTPAEPNILEQAFAAARGWLFGGNTIVRMGLVILFVGLSFLARYAASAGLFPVELRLALVIAVGIALLAVGFRTRDSRPGFAVALQGTGVATIYLTLFAAARMFELIPIVPVFALMIVVCALGCALALLQNAQGLAVASFAGGFAVPLLLSGPDGNVLIPFAYYTILNLAILVIARQRSWRFVNLIGFAATFGVAGVWGMGAYDPALYAAAQFFLIVSVLIYVATAILYAHNTPGRFGNVVDSTLLFGPALAGFGLQVGLVKDVPFGSAFAALGFAVLYLLLAGVAIRRRQEGLRLLTESLLAVGIGFVTLAVPLALGARWTSSAWAIEGAAAFWLGARQARWLPRAFGLLLQLVAMLVFLGSLSGTTSGLPLLNPDFLGAMLIALPALATAWWLRGALPHDDSRWARAYAGVERQAGAPSFLLGFAYWCLAWTLEMARIGPSTLVLLAMLAFVASAALSAVVARRRGWPVATWPSRVTLVALVFGFFASVGEGDHILFTPNWAIWIAAIGLHLWLLRANDRDATGNRSLLAATHVGGAWLATAMLADCLWLGVDAGDLWDSSWAGVVFLVSATAILAALTQWAGRSGARRWPLDTHAAAYYWAAALPIAALVFVGALLTAVFASGEADPLPYIPLLNPIDLSLALALGALLLWRRTILATAPARSGWVRGNRFLVALALLAFVVVNTVWMRIAHHLLGVAWGTDALLDSFVVQTGLAILWTSLALVLMVVASRRTDRQMWLAGAALLGLVVVKLVLVDLSNAGGGERIVTFIVVGALMLVVGYLAPLPPKVEAAA